MSGYVEAGYWEVGYAVDDVPVALGGEPIRIVEIVQPLCSRVFGSSPCLATGSPCYNTDKSCKYLPALDMSQSMSIFFVEALAAPIQEELAYQVANAIPALVSVQTAPTVLNVGGGDSSKGPLGMRSVISVSVKDFPYNDYQLDPYLSLRAYDPITKGSFWSKWLARNPFYDGYALNFYDGFLGQKLEDMTKRQYIISKIDRNTNGVTISARDILGLPDNEGALCPAASSGVLTTDISVGQTHFTVSGADLSQYPETGLVRIGDEIIAYTSRVDSSGDIYFSGLTRGALDTEHAAHDQFDGVQTVVSFVDAQPHQAIYELLTVYGQVPASYIDYDAWAAEFSQWRAGYTVTRYLTEPAHVGQLIGGICQQTFSMIWWDERTLKIKWKAIRAAPNARRIGMDNIISKSLSIRENSDQRATAVWVYYGLRSPILAVSEKANYRAAEIVASSEAARQYRNVRNVEILAPWLDDALLSRDMAGLYLARYKNTRQQITFDLSAKDAVDIWTGDSISIDHYLLVDVDGSATQTQWLITSAEPISNGLKFRYSAEDNGSAGVLWAWTSDSETRPISVVGAWVNDDGTDASDNATNFRWL